MVNRCKFCNKEINGISVCGCNQSILKKELWDKTLRREQSKIRRGIKNV